jgi:hypothetical protein
MTVCHVFLLFTARLRFVAGLSNRIEVESYFLIKSKVFTRIESNRMKFSIFDTIRFDLDRKVNKKNPEL